jgi:hypothetical protein
VWDGWEEWRAGIEGKVRALEAEIEGLKAQGQNGLLVNQVTQDIAIPPSQPLPAQPNDIEAFEVAYNGLEHDRHVLIWQLRKTLNLPKERVDDVIRQLRDEERYQPMEGAETAKMTDEQLQAVFVDENDFKFHAVMRVPAKAAEPMSATEPEPEPEPEATTPEESPVPVTEPKDEPEPEAPVTPQRRRRGRPSTKEKPEQATKATKKKVKTSKESPATPKLTAPEEPPVQATEPKRGPGRPKGSGKGSKK